MSDTRAVKFLSSRYIEYGRELGAPDEGLGGYCAPPFQFGFIVQYNMYNSSPTWENVVHPIVDIDLRKYTTAIWHLSTYVPIIHDNGSNNIAYNAMVTSGKTVFDLATSFNDTNNALSNIEFDVVYSTTSVDPPSIASQYPANDYNTIESNDQIPYVWGFENIASPTRVRLTVNTKSPRRTKGFITIL